MPERGEPSVTIGCERQFVHVCGTIAERKHLLAGQRHPHRALERVRRQHGERQFILRAQSGSESASDVGRQHAHFVARHPEHAGHVVAAVLGSLRLVEDGNAVVALPHCRRREWLHWIVVLDRHAIFRFDPHRGLLERRRGLAARDGVLRVALRNRVAFALRVEIGDVRLALIFDANERSGKSRDLELLRDD